MSLLLPAIEVANGPSFTGLEILRQGWQGTRLGIWAWYANPLFLLAVLFAGARYVRIAVAFSALAIGIGLTSFRASVTAAVAGSPLPEYQFSSGFYLWLASQLALFLFCLGWSVVRQKARHGV